MKVNSRLSAATCGAVTVLVTLIFASAGCARSACVGELREATLDFISAVAREKQGNMFFDKRQGIEHKLRACWGSFTSISAPMTGDLNHVTLSIYAGSNELLKSALKERRGESDGTVDLSTAVHLASSYGDRESIDEIASAGVVINQLNELGQSPIFSAMSYQPKPCEMLDTLTRNGVDIEGRAQNGATPLVFSIVVGNTEMAGCLLSRGARSDYQFEGKMLSDLARERDFNDLAINIERKRDVTQ